jgi:hypothetical protein
MLKKSLLSVLFTLLTGLLTANADETPWWINQTQAWESNGIIYAVSSAPYRPDFNDQAYLASFRQVTANDINKIKTVLSITEDKNLIGFQVIYVYYTTDSFYLLGAAPKAPNVQNMPEPPQTLAPTQPGKIENHLNWQTGPEIFEATNDQDVAFACAVGHGTINPQMLASQQKTSALRAATVDAQNKVKKYLNLNRILRGFQVVDTYFKGNDAFVLGCAPKNQ